MRSVQASVATTSTGEASTNTPQSALYQALCLTDWAIGCLLSFAHNFLPRTASNIDTIRIPTAYPMSFGIYCKAVAAKIGEANRDGTR
ncbi:hypothetical protein HQ40_07870 [Porphyromonas gulae]|uniref:Uncharacterized protein n=1 Tax=Porphyromonas gulae TaxID=111105 RepID=A0A0A2F5G1_9PORP|nr:hypothetical protein HQ40_07870 [Porphyromonas gulae]KGN86228.1 hypothetical protein HR15_08125 [Porphyromonas gulae]KGO01884.1 hypothetical protein HQ42_09800 [Porphyromonas gulae]